MTTPKPGSAAHRFQSLRANRERMQAMLKEVEESGDRSAKSKEMIHTLMAAMIHSRLGEMLMSTMLDAVKAGTVDEHGLPNDMPDDLRNDLMAAGIDPRTPEFLADPEATQQAIGQAIQRRLKTRGIEDSLKDKIKEALNSGDVDVEVGHMKMGADGWPEDMDPEQKAHLISIGAEPPNPDGFPPGLPPELIEKLRAMGMTGAAMVKVTTNKKPKEMNFTGAAGTTKNDGSDFQATPEYRAFLENMNKLGAKAVRVTNVKLSDAEAEQMKAALADAGTTDVNAIIAKPDDAEGCACPACRVKAIVQRAIAARKAEDDAANDPLPDAFPGMPEGSKPH